MDFLIKLNNAICNSNSSYNFKIIRSVESLFTVSWCQLDNMPSRLS